MAWRVARSLDTLLSQLNNAFPRRSKVSDGGIGDAQHSSRSSDHNPWHGPGIVTARDFTHDPANGLDCDKLAEALVKARDPRVKYIIWNRRIIDSRPGNNPWKWMPYSGSNPHTKHLHLSVMASSSCDSTAPWSLPGLTGVSTPTEEDSMAQVPQEQWEKVHRQQTTPFEFSTHHGATKDDQLGHTLSIRKELVALRGDVRRLADAVAALAARDQG